MEQCGLAEHMTKTSPEISQHPHSNSYKCMSADVGVEYAKCSSIGQLMGCLMREYGIKPKKTDKVRDVPQ